MGKPIRVVQMIVEFGGSYEDSFYFLDDKGRVWRQYTALNNEVRNYEIELPQEPPLKDKQIKKGK